MSRARPRCTPRSAARKKVPAAASAIFASSRPRVPRATSRVHLCLPMGRPSFDLARPRDKDYEAAPVLRQDFDDGDGFPVEAAPKRNREPNRKMYLFFFISITVILCFGLFVVVPQLIDYFTAPNDMSIESEKGIFGSRKQSVVQILNTERSRRNQERLEILRRFKDLQENYKNLQIEFEKAKENYLNKLRNAYKTEGLLETSVENLPEQTSDSSPEQDDIFRIDIEVNNEHENKTLSTETIENTIVP